MTTLSEIAAVSYAEYRAAVDAENAAFCGWQAGDSSRMRWLELRARKARLWDTLPLRRKGARAAPPVCDCYAGKCRIDAGDDAPAGRACARYDGVYAA